MTTQTLEATPQLGSETITALQDLLQANIDGAKGFDTIADATNDPFVEVRFADRADERRTNAEALARLVQVSGEEPREDGTWLAAFHRNWIAIKATLTNGDAAPMLAEIERGEQYLVDRYEAALAECPPAPVQESLQSQLAGVKEVIRLVQAERAKLDA